MLTLKTWNYNTLQESYDSEIMINAFYTYSFVHINALKCYKIGPIILNLIF